MVRSAIVAPSATRPRPGAYPQPILISPTNSLAKLDNATLARSVGDLTAEMRREGAMVHQAMSANQPCNGCSAEAAFNISQKRMSDASDQQNFQWQTNYQPRCHALLEEMANRLGQILPSDGRIGGEPMGEMFILQSGSLAGPSPLSEVSDYMEKMARQLPSDPKQ